MDTNGKEKIVRFGLIGLGIAATAFLPALSKHPGIRIVAAARKNNVGVTKFQDEFQATVYQDAADLCKDPNVDAVYISTPTQLHKEHVILAANHKKHIIIEKPMASTLQDALEMVEAVERNGVKMVVGHSHSFDQPIQKMREIIESGRLGKLKMIHNWYFNDWIYRPRLPEELDTSKGGGVTFRQGSHQFDIIRYLGGGKVKSVRSHTGIWDRKRPTEGSHTVFMEFEDDVVATAVYNAYDHFHTSEISFGLGEDGQDLNARKYRASYKKIQEMEDAKGEESFKRALGYGGDNQGNLIVKGNGQPFFGFTVVQCEFGDIRQSSNGLYIYDEAEKSEIELSSDVDGRDNVVKELYDSIVHDRPLIHDGRWGIANLEVCIAVIESSRLKKELYLKHQVPLINVNKNNKPDGRL